MTPLASKNKMKQMSKDDIVREANRHCLLEWADDSMIEAWSKQRLIDEVHGLNTALEIMSERAPMEGWDY